MHALLYSCVCWHRLVTLYLRISSNTVLSGQVVTHADGVRFFTSVCLCVCFSARHINKYVRLQGRPYVHACRSYIHTYIHKSFLYSAYKFNRVTMRLRPHAARYSTNVASLSDKSASARARRIRPILGFWGSKVQRNT